MQLTETIRRWKEIQRTLYSYRHAIALLGTDGDTVAPRGGAAERGLTLGTLTNASYNIQTGAEMLALMDELSAHAAELDRQTARELEVVRENYERVNRIPEKEYTDYTILTNEAGDVWHDAKHDNDFARFAPYLEKIVAYKKSFAAYYDDSRPVYDVLLDEYETGLTAAVADSYFDTVKAAVVPLVQAIKDKGAQPDTEFMHAECPVEKQRELSAWLMKVMTVDPRHCVLGETEHPFTSEMNKDDVRITTHYYPRDFISSAFSVIHESGHALYELNGGDEFRGTVLACGTSMGIHESQSRFYENIIGRSREFTAFLLPELQRIFPPFAALSAEQLYRAVNRAEPSLIRIEADELTYSLHIIVRYEIEKALFAGDITVAELPAVWRELYKKYLGVDVPDDTRGVLQDSHWGNGQFGYFPSYSLGSAYGAQMLNSMKKDVDVFACAAKGELAPIVKWLSDHIYCYSKLLKPAEVIMNCCGEPFEPKYYVDYLSNKFSDIYNL